MHYNCRKHIAVWNSLPNIIVNAESTNIFKNGSGLIRKLNLIGMLTLPELEANININICSIKLK